MRVQTIIVALALPAAPALAQGGPPPPPPPLQPLAAPVAPPQNPTTVQKADLGRALFWDEQLSSTNTVACGSCHFSSAGGSDPRSVVGDPASTHPGADGVLGTADDVTGSPGVVLNSADGRYQFDPVHGLSPQVTARKAPSTVGAAYAPELFWDGRAGGALVDPVSGQTAIPAGAALEAQALGPPLSTVEMGHTGRDWLEVAAKVAASEPLALSPQVPVDLEAWIGGRSYAELFDEVFGTPDVTPVRIAMAIAAYERTIVPTQTPLDTFLATGQGLTPQEQNGFQLFGNLGCATCHAGNRFTDDAYHYIGVRPVNEDLGRFVVTGLPGHRGAFKTPTLRNVRDRGPYMHDGRFATLEEVVDFYDRGGDFDAPNKAPQMQPLNLAPGQRMALLAFLRRPLTDQRAANETGPFARPLLAVEAGRVPSLYGAPTAGSGGVAPRMVALEPPHVGSARFTLALADGLAGAPALLAVDVAPDRFGLDLGGLAVHLAMTPAMLVLPAGPLAGAGVGGGYTSLTFDLGSAVVPGQSLYAQWFVVDTGAAGGLLAASEAASMRFF